ncbi:hypothetical protein BSKO_07874 [Bryopsis sp. KO-2023]|nr:hypothetical protein BSKO_07874 [Bryopsis sp. KO-2023]
MVFAMMNLPRRQLPLLPQKGMPLRPTTTVFRKLQRSARMPKRGIRDFFHKVEGSGSKKRKEDPSVAPTGEFLNEKEKSTAVSVNENLPLGEFRTGSKGQDGDENGDTVEQGEAPSGGKEGTSADGEGNESTDAQQGLILANRNSALARQAVTRAKEKGGHPKLNSLLVEKSWGEKLEAEFSKPYMATLESFVEKEWSEGAVFPAPFDIFRALNSVPFERVRVVIIGQDPYHNTNQAMGLSFSVPKSEKVPSSLQNVYKEIMSDIGGTKPTHGDLTKWSLQGVLLLNAVLTVKAHKANSHAKKGWENFTEAAISQLNKNRSGLVFILWGKFAQTRGKNVDTSKHLVLKSVHPSGLSANKGFYGCKHFSKTNAYLEKKGLEPIDWQIE